MTANASTSAQRYYSEAQTRNRVDAFFETLALRKGGGGN